MSGGLSHCLSRCRKAELSESELEQDAVKNDTVFSVQLIPQPLEERSLLRSKCLAVEIVSLRNLDPATVASPHRLNGIRTGNSSTSIPYSFEIQASQKMAL